MRKEEKGEAGKRGEGGGAQRKRNKNRAEKWNRALRGLIPEIDV